MLSGADHLDASAVGQSTGSTLATGVAEFLSHMAANGVDPSVAPVGIDELRSAAAHAREPFNRGGPGMLRTDEHWVPTKAGPVRIRVHTPDANSAATVVYLHGGGWTLLDLDTHDRLMRELASKSGLTVVGVDYPRAPESGFPVPVEACTDVFRALRATPDRFGASGGPIALGGDSAGANLALAAAIALRDCGEAGPEALLLFYGVCDCDLSRPSYAAFGSPPFQLTPAKMEWFWRQYCPDPARRRDPLASPLRADLGGLPPSRIVIAELDILRDENAALAERLRAAGNVVAVERCPGLPHGFLEALALIPAGAAVLQRAAAWLQAAVFAEGRAVRKEALHA